MTRDDIIRMAREAGADCEFAVHIPAWDMSTWEFMERFAALVAAAERDRTKRLVEDMQNELRQRRMTGKDT